LVNVFCGSSFSYVLLPKTPKPRTGVIINNRFIMSGVKTPSDAFGTPEEQSNLAGAAAELDPEELRRQQEEEAELEQARLDAEEWAR